MRRSRQSGFTLTELLVVVSIIGVLVTMAIVYMRPRVRPIDVAMRVGDLVHEAGRRAVALGPVRANVAVALGTKARTLILADQIGLVNQVRFTSYRLQEAADGSATGTWQPISSYVTDKDVLPLQWAKNAVDQTQPMFTSWPSFAPPSTTGFMVQCKPDGTCDSRTLFFCKPNPTSPTTCDPTGPSFELKAKLAIMQLGGAINTRTDWL
jgi:prepilin-type N-terminal cleavage/methylation domain-containing protein